MFNKYLKLFTRTKSMDLINKYSSGDQIANLILNITNNTIQTPLILTFESLS